MADEPNTQEKSADKPADKSAEETTQPPRAAETGNPNIEEAKAREAELIEAAGDFTPVVNGPEEDPYRGIDPQFIY